ncbi:hypothetical protein JB92DRAFT_660461 [Gautieria morchelliformis]|nr:hypothetical protein JB92DRAFT_660461 [Gautieria morchelliformis]
MSITASLSKLKSEPEFLRITHEATTKPLPSPALTAIWSTLSFLSASSHTPDQIGFFPPYLTLVLSSSAHNLTSFPPSEGTFVENLTRAAHVTSTSLSCSSVLAGLSSESDEFGDVGILLPHLGADKEREIVNLLGLDHWLLDGGKIVKSGEISNNMPSGLAQIPQTQRVTARPQLDELTSLLSRLHDPFEFRLQGGQGNEGMVIWVFLGKLTLDKETVWTGLLGAGIYADF